MIATLMQLVLTIALACASVGIFVLWLDDTQSAVGATLLLLACALIGVLCEAMDDRNGRNKEDV